MLTCPKCSFTQPPDQYCAQCGVDMATYRPRKKPILRRILGNTYVQFLIIALAVILTVGYVMNREQERAEFRQSLLDQNPNYQALEKVSARDLEYEKAATPQPKRQRATPPPRVRPKPKAVKTVTPPPTPKTNRPQMRTVSAEISEEFLTELFYQSTFDGGYDDQRFAIIPNLGSLIANGKSQGQIKVQSSSGRKPLVVRKTMTTKISDLTMLIQPSAASSRGLDMDLSISSPIDGVAEESQLIFQESLSIPPGSGLIITGLIRREETSDEEELEDEEPRGKSVIFFEFSSSPRRNTNPSGQGF